MDVEKKINKRVKELPESIGDYKLRITTLDGIHLEYSKQSVRLPVVPQKVNLEKVEENLLIEVFESDIDTAFDKMKSKVEKIDF